MLNKPSEQELDELTEKIIDCAARIHSTIGPGLMECAYGNILSLELIKNNLHFSHETMVKVKYEGVEVGNQKADLIVEDKVVVELESAACIEELIKQQLSTYLRVSGKRAGLILNFGNKELEVKRMVIDS